ncbi:putative F-box/kelch-repeat protein [Cardamine amara subsp. amara]|uniref:F-box/kelch-repeat protein n=1 Tax=Cardamine amara subsp. amara TaxID=228776 RepID=A0ABD1C6G9_CARAN
MIFSDLPCDLESEVLYRVPAKSLAKLQTTCKRGLVVWDPCTGQTRSIRPRTCYGIYDYYYLGYVNSKSSCHSYKILRSHSYQNDLQVWITEFEIYKFSSDSWRVLDVTREWGPIFCDGMSLKENTYWVVGPKETDFSITGFFMLYFDYTTETLGRLPLPFKSDNHEDNVVYQPSSCGWSPCGFAFP